MLGPFHWTLLALFELCFGCALLNFIQWRATGNVRWIGILVCAFWAAQELVWFKTGELAILAGCVLLPAIIIAVLVKIFPHGEE